MDVLVRFFTEVGHHLGLSVAFACVMAAVAAGPLWLTGRARAIPLVAALGFVVGLAMLPFPDRATFDCTATEAHLMWVPFEGVGESLRWTLFRGDLVGVVTSRAITSTIMNVVFFMGPGLALVWWRPGTTEREAAIAGFALSLAIETTQLSGNLGLYPCPYRFPDVTDLFTNTLGVWLGAKAMLERRLPMA